MNKIFGLCLDLIFEDGVCVKASDCPCEHHGMLYPSGHIIQEDCNNWSDIVYEVVYEVYVCSVDHFYCLIARVWGEYGTAQRTTAQVCVCFSSEFLFGLFSIFYFVIALDVQ